MADHKTMTAAGEAAIGDQRHLIAQATPHDGRGGGEHFTHARPTAGAFIANHYHVARHHCAVVNPLLGFFFGTEHPCRAGKVGAFLAGDLGHRAVRRQVAIENAQVTFRFQRLGQGRNNRLIQGIGRHIGQVFRQRSAGHRQAIALQ